MVGASRRGFCSSKDPENAIVVRPPKVPIPMAAMALAIAKSHPSVPEVIKNIAGSIKGDASQNAITALSGIPSTNKAAMKGITSQEQNGDSPPQQSGKDNHLKFAAHKTLAIKVSAPDALRTPTAVMANKINGAVPSKAPVLNRRVGMS